MAEMSLSFAIEAINKASEGIGSAKESIAGLESSATSAHGATSQIGSDLEDLDEKGQSASSGGIGSVISGFGGMAAAALAGSAGIAGVAAAMDAAIDKTSQLADQTEKLSAATGLSDQDSSRLIFAFGQMGVSAEDTNSTLDKFAKGLQGLELQADGSTTKSNALTQQLQQMGVSVTDASGNALSMTNVLGQVADKFAQMPDGPEKTALAMQLFGKSAGPELLPYLDQGSAGLDKLMQESDKLGLTLSGSTVDAARQAAQAHREMTAAVDGLEVQLGTALMPAVAGAATGLANFSVWFNTQGIPAIRDFVSWISEHLQPVFQALGAWVNTTFLPAWKQDFQEITLAVQAVVQFVQDHWDGIRAIILPILDIIRAYVESTFDVIKTIVQTVLNDIQDIIQVVMDLIRGDWSGAWDGLKKLVSDTLEGIKGILGDELGFFKTALSDAWSSISAVLGDAWDGMKSKIEEVLKGILGDLQHLPQQLLDAVGDLSQLLVQKGIDIIKGLEQGILQEAKNLPGQVGGAIQGAISSIPGVGGALSKIPGLAEGGVIQVPTLAVVGESGPEAVIPLKDLSLTQPAPLSSLPGMVGVSDAGAPSWGQVREAGAGGHLVGTPDVQQNTLLSGILEQLKKSDTSTQTQHLSEDIATLVHGGAWTDDLSRQVNADLSQGNIGKALSDMATAVTAINNSQILPNMLTAIGKSDVSQQMSQVQTNIADLVHGGQFPQDLANQVNAALSAGEIGVALKLTSAAVTHMDNAGLLNTMITAINTSNQQQTLQQIQSDIAEAWQHGEWTPKLADQIQADLAAGDVGQALKDITAATQASQQHLTVMDAIAQANAAAMGTVAAGAATAQRMGAVNVGPGSFGAGGVFRGSIGPMLQLAGRGVGMASGGLITEPIYGVGASGTPYMFGENGPERVTPGAGSGMTFVIQTLDAQSMAASMPTLARQLQLYLQRAGMNGLS